MSFYPKRKLRESRSLNGIWGFHFIDQDDSPETLQLESLAFDDVQCVPGAFDATPRYAGKRGTGVYRTYIETTPGARASLQIEGLGLWARVFVDNDPVETIRLPYSGVEVELPVSEKTRRELTIVVNNVYNEKRTPLFHQYYDFYGYGGIYRSVNLRELPECAIDRVRVRTIDHETGKVKLTITLSGTTPEALEFTVAFDEGERESYTLPVLGNCVELEAVVPDFQQWSPENPHLHTVTVTIDEDDITERFGIRVVRAEDGQITINGKAVKLLGFCRHESHPEFGPALPDQLLIEDLHYLKELGANFIRGVHYPMDQRFLNLCDHCGFLVWEESLGWQNNSEQFQNEDFYQLQLHQTRQMVRNSYNHPSILMWGFLNESNSEDTTTDMYKDLCELIRKEDPSRLVTYASNHPYSDLYWKYVDVISVNIYPGWYAWDKEEVRPLHEIKETIEKVRQFVEKEGFSDKPFIISEIGAGAIYGFRDQLKSHWSEEYQSDYLSEICNAAIEDERISGLALWHFVDCRTYNSARALFRPRAFNNKGIMDEYRRPKLAFHKVCSIFNYKGEKFART